MEQTDPIGIRAPICAWGGVPHVTHILGSPLGQVVGLGEVRVNRVAYLPARLSCSPILTRFREGLCKLIVCTI